MGRKSSHFSTIHQPRYKALIKKLIATRMDAGLKQEDVAKMLGLTQPDVSKIERFERKLDALELIQWLEATGSDFKTISS
jgi:transcriptional regulator with XRE-family HTH domain